MTSPLKKLLGGLNRRLGFGSYRLVKKLQRNHVHPDIVIPGHIAIDMTKMVLFNIDLEVSVRFAEITDIAVCNFGEDGFMENYVLLLETTRYDLPKLEWHISNSRADADQAARIVNDVVSGALLSADSDRLPKSTKALAQFALSHC